MITYRIFSINSCRRLLSLHISITLNNRLFNLAQRTDFLSKIIDNSDESFGNEVSFFYKTVIKPDQIRLQVVNVQQSEVLDENSDSQRQFSTPLRTRQFSVIQFAGLRSTSVHLVLSTGVFEIQLVRFGVHDDVQMRGDDGFFLVYAQTRTTTRDACTIDLLNVTCIIR